MSKLTNPIKNAIAEALKEAKGSPEKPAELVEALATGVGMCVAVSSRGNAKAMGEFLEGTTQLIYEQAAFYQKFGAFMGNPRV
jgi:hypothetical protein